jgi:hypothetical protein
MKRPLEDDLPESMAQMSLKSKKRMINILPSIKILEPEPLLPKLTLNPEHSQLVLYKTIPLHNGELLEHNALPNAEANDKESDMEWE